MSVPVNTRCPWSGEPVSRDALTRYRGRTVGFCNPGCRDKFDAATRLFDEGIDRERPPGSPQPAALAAEPYARRRFRSIGVTVIGEARFKTYLIDRAGAPLGGEGARDALLRYAERCPVVHAKPEPTFGHVIVHRGDEADWLLAHWWKPGGVLRGLTGQAPVGTLAFEPADTSLIACVWEQVVMAHERGAWVRHAMTSAPDVEAYIADTLADGDY